MLENWCMQVQAKAQAMATALQTIGKFSIRKRSGDKESIFGRYGRVYVMTNLPLPFAAHPMFDFVSHLWYCLHTAHGLSRYCMCVV